MFVRDAMCDRAEWIQPTVTIQQAARMMRDQAIGCLPVGENDRLIGIITDRDLAYRGCADGAGVVASFVAAESRFCSPDCAS